MNERDKKQIEVLEKFVAKRPKPHTCQYCISGMRDWKGRLRCTDVDSPEYQNIMRESDSCGKWEVAR